MFTKDHDDYVQAMKSLFDAQAREWNTEVRKRKVSILNDISNNLQSIFNGDFVAFEKFDRVMLDIESRWDALMRRRSTNN